MAATITANPVNLILVLTFEDFRGQRMTRRLQLLGTATDVQIQALVDSYDAVTNCRIIKADLESVRVISGTKGLAANSLERNLSEQFELAFLALDPVSSKNVTKTVIIPAMVASIELTDGSPDPLSTILNNFLVALAPLLVFTEANGTVSSAAMIYNVSESHHITVADKVDVT